MAHVITKVSLVILLFFVAACPGLKFLRLLGINRRGVLEVFVLAAGCGFALTAEGLLLLGMTGLFTPVAVLLLPMVLFVLSAREALYFLKSFRSALAAFSFRLSAYSAVLAAFIIFIAINVLKALLPPHGPTDVLYYHMTLPKLYLAKGAIVTYPTFFPSFFPSNGEVLFALSLILGGPVLVNLTHFGFALLTVLALYACARKSFAKEYALLPGIFYLTAPVVNSWGTMAYTGNMLGFYLFLLFILMMEYNAETTWREGIVWAVLAGMALGTKYQAIPVLGLIYLFFVLIRVKRWKRFLPLVLLSLIGGALLVSPWFVRNLLLTENPFFPILRDLFPSKMLWSETTWGVDTKGGHLLVAAIRDFVDNPVLPFTSLFSAAWEKDDFQRFMGPLFLGFAPAVFFVKRTPAKWPLIILTGLFCYLSAFVLRGNIRYVIILVILLSLLAGAAVQEMFLAAKKREHLFLSFFLIIVIGLYSLQNYHLMLSEKRILTSLNPQLTASFLRAFERSYRAAEFANQHLPEGAKVLFHGVFRYYYFNFEPLNDQRRQRAIIYDSAQNEMDILAIMRSHGITHIISEDVIPENARANTVLYDEDPRFVEFSRRYLEKIFSANGISIYRIGRGDDGEAGGKGSASCKPSAPSLGRAA